MDPTPAEAAPAKRKIVIVEDNPVQSELVFEALKEQYDCSKAASGEEALNLIQKVMPDLVLMDLMMPDSPSYEGYEAVRRLAADPKTASIPIIINTGFNDTRMLDLISQGPNVAGILIKPVDLKVLREKIESALKNRVHRSVLVVEDVKPVAEVISHSLATHYRVTIAGTGREALQSVQKERPDLIILDLMLPDASGYEFVRSLQSHEEMRGVPILIYTGANLNSATLDMIRQEPNVINILFKPLSGPALRQKVMETFQKLERK